MKVYFIVNKVNNKVIWKNKFYKYRKNAEKILNKSFYGRDIVSDYWKIVEYNLNLDKEYI